MKAFARGARVPYAGEALVSVVIPTRNRRELLMRAVQSVLAQSYDRVEVLVVDDGSDDGSGEMLASLGDARVQFLPNPERRGAGYSRERGAALSRGRFIAFLDSDDWWLPDKLRLQLEAAEAAGTERTVVIGPPACDDGLGSLLPVDQPVLAAGQRIADYVYAGRQATILSSCLLVEGELGRAVRFDPTLRVNQDTDYLLRLEAAGARFCCIAQPLYVLDTRRRVDRISYDPRLHDHSRAWFDRVSGDWSDAARRGYLLWDLSVRCASTGRRAQGLYYYFAGFSLQAGVYRVGHQLLRVLGRGEVPEGLRRLRRLLWRRAPQTAVDKPALARE